MAQPRLIRIQPADNVAVAVDEIPAGTAVSVDGIGLVARQIIPLGHKIALTDIPCGQNVIKYGFPIGHAVAAIGLGEHVHLHNMATNLQGLLEYAYEPEAADSSAIRRLHAEVPKQTRRLRSGLLFDGYLRSDGQVGIRNEIWIIPTVGCVNKVAERLAAEGRRRLAGGNLEGVFAFPHPYGCSQLGDDMLNTQKLLAGLVRHPNAGGVLVIGLGCEYNNIAAFRGVLDRSTGTEDQRAAGFSPRGLSEAENRTAPAAWSRSVQTDARRVRYLAAQEVEDEFEAGMDLLEELADRVRSFTRTPVSISRLKVGLKCGGSDGFSGITANPLLGAFSDELLEAGGATLLTEVPEMFGAETILMKRCASREVFDKCVRLINDFKEYMLRHNQPIYENPAPGNKAGGITTLEDKSLGCTQKGGTGPVVDVLEYAQAATRAGLNLVSSPSNDIVSVSALAAAGAHMILFTTGRGTPLGGPVPTVKLSTNTELARRKPAWIDFDAGVLLDGKPMPELVDELFTYCLDVASGRRRTRNEENDFREIAIFKDGVTV